MIRNGSTMIRNMLFYCRKPNVVTDIIRFLTTDYELGVSASQGQLAAGSVSDRGSQRPTQAVLTATSVFWSHS